MIMTTMMIINLNPDWQKSWLPQSFKDGQDDTSLKVFFIADLIKAKKGKTWWTLVLVQQSRVIVRTVVHRLINRNNSWKCSMLKAYLWSGSKTCQTLTTESWILYLNTPKNRQWQMCPVEEQKRLMKVWKLWPLQWTHVERRTTKSMQKT